MKTTICLIMGLTLAVVARADPNRYEWRMLGKSNVDLQPLFAWWTFASETTNQPFDITEMNPDKLEEISNLWTRLPARVLANWYRLSGSEGGIVEVGNMWKVDAVIEPAPMMLRHEVVYLRNPPVREIQDFKLARAQFTSLQNSQSGQATNQVIAPPAQPNPNQAKPVDFPGTITTANGVVVARTGAAAVEQNLAQTVAISNRVETAKVSHLAALGSYLATFPSTNIYCLDHFALRTGTKIDGLEVYDLGASAGLNY